jgi:hypothetical protein
LVQEAVPPKLHRPYPQPSYGKSQGVGGVCFTYAGRTAFCTLSKHTLVLTLGAGFRAVLNVKVPA